MKKLLLTAAIAVFGIIGTQAQEVKFGAKAGYLNATAKVDTPEGDISNSESGFYVGALVDIGINESFHIQPEVLYGSANDASLLFIPIMAKYYVGDSGLSLMAGPQGTLDLEDSVDGYNSFGIDVAFGIGYDITENFFVDARYSLELTNRFEDAGDDVKGHINALQIGVGYKF